ncbi:MAG: DUF814 domain-containing protein, partial [Proteobacteria bacterium]
ILDLMNGKGPVAATGASRSGFDLFLDKTLPGLKVTKLSAYPDERILSVEFQSSPHPLILFLILIPAQPEAALVEKLADGSFHVIARSRTSEALEDFKLPLTAAEGSIKKAIPFREELVSTRREYENYIRAAIDRDEVDSLLAGLIKSESQILKKLKSQSDVSRTQALRAREEADYATYGDYLKSVVHEFTSGRNYQSPIIVPNGETDQPVSIPVDTKLTPVEQVQKFYWLAKRKEKRIQEGEDRALDFEIKVESRAVRLARLKTLSIENLKADSDRKKLRLEIDKLVEASGAKVSGLPAKDIQTFIEFPGKRFSSKEGLTILVGRNSKENLELTTRLARGNDLWFHVKGRPGAHVVIILRDRKNASLETMLDAAMLTIFYSGGKEWGKTEVDYTFRKFVKKIKNSTEVTYTQNKTLSVTIDQKRLNELLVQEQ